MLFRLDSNCVTLIGQTCCTISPDDTNFQTPNCGFWSNLVRTRINHNHKGKTENNTGSIVVLWLQSSTECPVSECVEQAKATVRHLLFGFVRRSNSIFIELCGALIETGKDLTDEKVPLLGKRCV